MKKVIYPLIMITLYIFFIKFCTGGSKLCEYYAKDLSIYKSGVVDRVFVDSKNHNAKKVVLKTGGRTDTFFLDMDKTGLFDFLLPNDSILKEIGTHDVLVFRDNEKIIFTLDYGCEN